MGATVVAPTRPSDPRYELDSTYPDTILGADLGRRARSDPGRPAVVDGAMVLDYRELYERAQSFARGLAARGVRPGDVVTVQLPNWWEALVAFHGILAIGAVVNPVIPIYRDAEVGFIVEQARPSVVIVAHRFRGFDHAEMCGRVLRDRDDPPLVVVVRPHGELPAGCVAFDAVAADGEAVEAGVPGDVCLLLYTSGTTAEPKGVLHSHQTLGYENRSIIELFELNEESTVFMPSPVTHITGFLYGVLLPPILGVASVLMDVWDPDAARELVQANRCRFTVGATPFLQGLTEAWERAEGGACELAVFACGGADVPPELVRRAGAVLDAVVVRVYGSSELPTVSCGRPEDSIALRSSTDGRPVGLVRCRLDDDGQLLARGPELFVGYLDASLNHDAFTSDGFFRTGDLATIAEDGSVTIEGRQKDIILRNGENISAKEVEDLLYEHPAVVDVAVVAVPDARTGERACACVVPVPGRAPSLAELCSFLEERRIARQKLPEQLEVLDKLPRTSSGKVQKFLLRQQLQQ